MPDLAAIAKKVQNLNAASEILDATQDFWTFCKHVKTQDEEAGLIRPFPLASPQYDYLRAGLDESVNHDPHVTILLKSRRMFITGREAAYRLWQAWRNRSDKGESFRSLIVSMGEREATETVDRMRFMYLSLPDHFQRYNPLTTDNSQLLEFKGGGQVLALPASQKAGRSFGASDLWLDEFAFHAWARDMWGALIPTIGHQGRLLVTSTPNGKHNLFGQMWNADQRQPYLFQRLHYSADPTKNVDWVAKMKPQVDPDDSGIWEREYELSFIGQRGVRVFPSFNEKTHVRDFKGDLPKDTVLIRGWDFGYYHPACVWMYRDKTDRLLVLAELMGSQEDIRTFGLRIKEISRAKFPWVDSFVDYCDPSGISPQETADSEGMRNSIEVLKSIGIKAEGTTRKVGILDGVNRVRRLLRLRGDGQAGIAVSSKCTNLIDGFNGGYHMPDKENPGELPEKDGFYEHEFDALRYAVVGIQDIGEGLKDSPLVSYEDRIRIQGYDPVVGV